VKKTLALRKQSSDVLRIFVDFLETGRLSRPRTGESFSFGMLVDVFVFAGDFDILPLRNAALDAFFLRIIAKPDRLPYHRVYDIYKSTSSSSSLRGLMVEVILSTSGASRRYRSGRKTCRKAS
jgi:hypothetical protein